MTIMRKRRISHVTIARRKVTSRSTVGNLRQIRGQMTPLMLRKDKDPRRKQQN